MLINITPVAFPNDMGLMVAAPDLVVQQVVPKGHLARPKGAKGGVVCHFHPPIACVNKPLPRPYGESLNNVGPPPAALVSSLLSSWNSSHGRVRDSRLLDNIDEQFQELRVELHQ